jgi:heptosyltransferase-2
MGDVIRTTPLLEKIRKEFPKRRIFWLTQYPDILPKEVDWPLLFTLESLTWIRSLHFDWAVNLDKDPEACALLEQCHSKEKAGFGLAKGMPAPVNARAEAKFYTGISDSFSQKNRKHYLEEIFEICGWQFNGEKYLLPPPGENPRITAFKSDKKIIGLNTGCGARWSTRLWPEDYWTELCQELLVKGYHPLLLGGPKEDEKNNRIARATGADYLGVFPILDFIGLMKKCHVVVTSVTMAMHIAVGLGLPLVLFNNIFNPHEFYFYRNSIIVSPSTKCDCYYRPECIHGESCMKDLKVGTVLNAIAKLVI